MMGIRWMRRFGMLIGIFLMPMSFLFAVPADSLSRIKFFSFEEQPGFVFKSNKFYKRDNLAMKNAGFANAVHLKYGFQFAPHTSMAKIFPGSYQGIGLGYHTFGFKEELGNPLSIYIFHGARIGTVSPLVTFNYEWNFGLSFGWHPYDARTNIYNTVIGSKVNAYMNIGAYLAWTLSRHIDLNTGFALTHFSNGNTKFPNAGVNTGALKVGVSYFFNRNLDMKSQAAIDIPDFPRHFSYDLLLFGSFRRKGIFIGNDHVAVPKKFAVAGFNFSPMYNWSYRFKTGFSVDGVYDASTDAYALDSAVGAKSSGYSTQFGYPPFSHKIALGLSGRMEYVMPYFSINLGIGANVLHKGKDLKGLYQVLALKVNMSRDTYLNVGYNLQNFKDPNYLMLGIGYRFHNLYPKIRKD